jgi:hypothetical protein
MSFSSKPDQPLDQTIEEVYEEARLTGNYRKTSNLAYHFSRFELVCELNRLRRIDGDEPRSFRHSTNRQLVEDISNRRWKQKLKASVK